MLTLERVSVEGSYSSKLQVKAFDQSHLWVSGNPSKFLQGHNLFGSNDLKQLMLLALVDLTDRLLLEPSPEDYYSWCEGEYEVKCVDVAECFRLGSTREVENWIRAAAPLVRGKHQGVSSYGGETIYIGKTHASRIYCHLIPVFGQSTLASLTVDEVRTWIRSADMTAKSINNTLSPLRDVFSEAFQAELIDRNPLDRIPALPIVRREPKPFSTEKIEVELSELGKRSIAARDYFMFAFGTGLRTSELLALTWKDIDLERNIVVVTKAKVKGHLKKPKTTSGIRNVKLQPLAKEAITSMRSLDTNAHDVFIDDRTGRPWRSGQSLRKGHWYPALDSAGIDRRNPYQTRHTYASHLLSNGENPMYVGHQMGHADWGMIRNVYGSYINE